MISCLHETLLHTFAGRPVKKYACAYELVYVGT